MTLDHCLLLKPDLLTAVILYQILLKHSSEAAVTQTQRAEVLFLSLSNSSSLLRASKCRQAKTHFTGFSVVNGNSLIQFLCVWCQSWCFPSVSCVSLMMFSRNVCGTDFGQVLNCESRYLWYLPKLVVCVCVCVHMFLFVLWFIHLHLCVSCKWQCHLRQWEFYLSSSGLNKQCGHTLSRYLRGVTIVKTSLKSPRKHPQYPATKASSQCPC